MQLAALYDYLASTAKDGRRVGSFSWERVAQVAKVDPREDTRAFRALIDKGAMCRVTVPNTFGDVEYVLTVPRAELREAFRAALDSVGVSVRHMGA